MVSIGCGPGHFRGPFISGNFPHVEKEVGDSGEGLIPVYLVNVCPWTDCLNDLNLAEKTGCFGQRGIIECHTHKELMACPSHSQGHEDLMEEEQVLTVFAPSETQPRRGV